MRIVNAMFGCGQGGIEQALVDYCDALAFCGHEPVALVHPGAAVLDALKSRNIAIHTISNRGPWDPIAVFRIARLLKQLNPDVCIAHGNRAVSLLKKAAKGRRLVGAMHNYSIKCADLRFVFYPTQDLLHHVRGLGSASQHVYCVPNLVRAPHAMPEHPWHDPPVIGVMGRFVAKKGFDCFIEALSLLKERCAFEAVIAGDGEEAQALHALARSRGLENLLRFSGWVEDKRAFFESIDLFCLPSQHEPFGIVLLEAMAQGLPVVATDSEGPSEILRAGIDGMLVPKGDAGALAGTLFTLLSDRQHACLIARNAFDTVKSRYDLPVIAHKLDLALRAIGHL